MGKELDLISKSKLKQLYYENKDGFVIICDDEGNSWKVDVRPTVKTRQVIEDEED